MAVTPRLGLPLPVGTDLITTTAVGPPSIRALSTALDDAAKFGSSGHSVRPAPALAGRLWLSTDTGQVALDTGAAWIEIARTVVAATPPGVIMWSAGVTAPTGWLIANGASVSRTTYAALFALLGQGYGAGDGSTTFGLPDLRGRAPIGVGQGAGLTNRVLGEAVGTETHVLSAGEQPVHSHLAPDHAHEAGTLYADYAGVHAHDLGGTGLYTMGAGGVGSVNVGVGGNYGAVFAGGNHYHDVAGVTAAMGVANTGSSGSGAGHNNMPPSRALTPIIKT